MSMMGGCGAGEEEMQQAVMASGVADTFVAHLGSGNSGVREAATWCVLNLAFTGTATPPPPPEVPPPPPHTPPILTRHTFP